jgi:hypothetical protein
MHPNLQRSSQALDLGRCAPWEHEMSAETKTPNCLACERDSTATPLLPLEYRGAQLWICPQHLPVLIHDPTQLTGKLEGAEDMRAADHHD